MKILLTGGSGTLGKELLILLKQTQHEIYAPTSYDLDIKSSVSCKEWFDKYKPNIIIHSAAYTDVKASEENYIKSINTNIVGTCNIINCCDSINSKLVYISTDYVFDGKKGNYDIDDCLNPLTKYAKSKTAGELAVRMYPNSLVIRTSFFGKYFPYEKAFIDQWSSKDYIDIMAPKILNSALSSRFGIVHIASKKRTLYEIALERKKDVIPCSFEEMKLKIPKDTSLKE